MSCSREAATRSTADRPVSFRLHEWALGIVQVSIAMRYDIFTVDSWAAVMSSALSLYLLQGILVKPFDDAAWSSDRVSIGAGTGHGAQP